jgi:hypothetical protein
VEFFINLLPWREEIERGEFILTLPSPVKGEGFGQNCVEDSPWRGRRQNKIHGLRALL